MDVAERRGVRHLWRQRVDRGDVDRHGLGPEVPGTVSAYSIDLCVNWVRVTEAPTATFDGVVRNLATGEWTLTGMITALSTFKPGYSLADVDTVRVVQDQALVFAGYVRPVTTGIGGLQIAKTVAGEQFTLSGPDAWSVPGSRVAWPTPANLPPWPDSWDLRTGPASTVAAGYVLSNAGNLARSERQIPGLTVVDGSAGLVGTWSGRLQSLDDLVVRICRDGGIVCRLVTAFNGGLQMTFGYPRDRRATTVLSDQGDLTNIKRQIIPTSVNYVVAGGQGLLSARTFAASGTASGAARRESFSNQSSLSTAAEVQQSADTAVARGASSLTITAEATDSAAARVQYLVDYDVGDTIAVEIALVRYPVVVEAVRIHVGPERQVIRPVFGNAAPNLLAGLIRDVGNLQSRLDTQIA